ncbi:MAG: hypothetical protein AAFW73_27125 [Bacteroidota bacterium]
MITSLGILLFANAFIAFGIAFYWQAKVILSVFHISDWDGANVPWKGLANPNSPQNNLGRFFAGEIFPELRPKWSKAITYLVVSALALFLFFGVLQIIAPEYLS